MVGLAQCDQRIGKTNGMTALLHPGGLGRQQARRGAVGLGRLGGLHEVDAVGGEHALSSQQATQSAGVATLLRLRSGRPGDLPSCTG
jgi:hypothetical protein